MERVMSLIGSFDNPLQSVAAGGLFLFLSVLMISIFTFVSIAVWSESRRKEREAYYKAESMRRLAEMPGDGARQVIEAMREEERIKNSFAYVEEVKRREGLKIGGMVTIGVGIGLGLFMHEVGGPVMVGAIPGMVGVALLVYGLTMSPRP